MSCRFCPSRKDVNEKEICVHCRRVSKACKKGTGIYYNVKTKTYVQGDELNEPNPCIIFDLHGVADLFTLQEFIQLVQPLQSKVYLLSYVGSTTNTRLGACQWMEDLIKLAPHVNAFLCFARKDSPAPGNKGGFIQSLGSPDVTFLDDGKDHIEAAKNVSKAHLVPSDGKNFVQEIVVSLY